MSTAPVSHVAGAAFEDVRDMLGHESDDVSLSGRVFADDIIVLAVRWDVRY